METAGKQVDDDELRDLMKDNGIGRPSTRANIIETLFRRKYVVRKKKLLVPTSTGIKLIDTIQNKMLTSAELTGTWEKQLKEIEQGTYKAATFIKNMKQMVDALVYEVRMEERANISHSTAKAPAKKITKKSTGISYYNCPKCKQGNILKGKTVYGCSQFAAGCSFRMPFSFLGKKVSEKQLIRLIKKGSTVNLKGFKTNNGKADGTIIFNDQFEFTLKGTASKSTSADVMICPKCKKGNIIKGKTAYGCSAYKTGCNFRFSFEDIRTKAAGEKLTKELVYRIISKI